MPFFRKGRVKEHHPEADGSYTAVVEVDGEDVEAFGISGMTGPVEVGDRVVLNTTGLDLRLGTGGVAFLLWNLDGSGPEPHSAGHVVKLRYTPWQMDVLSAEAPESPHHDVLREAASLAGAPVVACSLHSQLAGVVAGVRAAAPDARIGYLMTDGGALPLGYSRLVRRLKSHGLIDVTCTAGHAFGGDLEAVNVFSGMIALRSAGGSDVIVCAMGPGVVGTGTRLGSTALEQGQLLDAATALGGHAIATLRIGFDDERDRHTGLSHHSLTALTIAARERALVAVPKLSPEHSNRIADELRSSGICDRHETRVADGRPALGLFERFGLEVTTMGRSWRDSPEPFLAAGAAGALAAALLRGDG